MTFIEPSMRPKGTQLAFTGILKGMNRLRCIMEY